MPCKCDSRDLFLFGCVCNPVEKVASPKAPLTTCPMDFTEGPEIVLEDPPTEEQLGFDFTDWHSATAKGCYACKATGCEKCQPWNLEMEYFW